MISTWVGKTLVGATGVLGAGSVASAALSSGGLFDPMTIVTAAGGALSATVAYLYQQNKKDREEDRARIDEQAKVIQETQHKLGLLEGRQDGIKQYATQVLEVVHRATNDPTGGG